MGYITPNKKYNNYIANLAIAVVFNFMLRKLLISKEIFFTLMEFNDYKSIKIFLLVKRKMK